ncbi:hypothetical protein D3C77_698940 [compost metagenome]
MNRLNSDNLLAIRGIQWLADKLDLPEANKPYELRMRNMRAIGHIGEGTAFKAAEQLIG